MKLRQIIEALEDAAPLALQESYDNSGLLVGEPDMDITSALITLDVTDAVMDEALREGSNLIIAHHPLLFHPLKKLTGSTLTERLVMRALRHGLALYAVHTNLDNAPGGVSHYMGQKLQLTQIRVLAPMSNQLLKLFTFVPHSHAEQVRQALFDAGAGHISAYDQCSFNAEGYGTFRGAAHTNPFVGQPGQQHREAETKIEVILPAYLKQQVLQALRRSHPYEEVAYDLVALVNDWQSAGAGVIGELPEPLTAPRFLAVVKNTFGTPVIRHSRPPQQPIRTVAVCGGAGSFLLPQALHAGADALVTADISYHRFFDADGRLLLCDIGHYESEQFTAQLLQDILRHKLPTFAARMAAMSSNPVNYFS